jgi:hypothetical protein
MNIDLDTLDLATIEIIAAAIEAEAPALVLELAREYGEIAGYMADDGNAEIEYEHATTRQDAAEEYVSDGDWGDESGTARITVDTWPIYQLGDVRVADPNDRESCRVELPATEPACSESEHDWTTPFEVLGGISENPGVWGNGGGVICRCICRHCGSLRTTDTWAQDPQTGEQGLDSISYAELGEHAYSEAYEDWRDAQDEA